MMYLALTLLACGSAALTYGFGAQANSLWIAVGVVLLGCGAGELVYYRKKNTREEMIIPLETTERIIAVPPKTTERKVTGPKKCPFCESNVTESEEFCPVCSSRIAEPGPVNNPVKLMGNIHYK